MSSSASAISKEQQSAFRKGALYFEVVDSAANTCGSAATLTGSENTEKTWNFLIGKGLTPPQAAGVMGNLQAESGINPKRVQSTNTPEGDRDDMVIGTDVGYGLAQWTSKGRQEGLHAAAVAAGVKDSDLGVQLEYLWKEMNSGEFYDNGFARLKATSDYREATSLFMLHFERPKDQSQAKQNARAAFSLGWLNKYGSVSPTATTGDTVVVTNPCGGAGSSNGTYSLPLDRKIYDKTPTDFTKPHHRGSASDIPIPIGLPVYSMTAGKIIKAPTGGDCGTGVLIEAEPGVQFVYCHGTDGGAVAGAKQGDTVKAGQLIMHSGNTGESSGPHLHVGITVNGQKRCPQSMFTAIATGAAVDIRSLPATGCSKA